LNTEAELKDKIRSKVVKLATELGRDASTLQDDDILLARGLLDSAAVLELIVWLEEESKVELDPGDLSLENFGSVSLIVTYLTARH
jgi:D-alanine--poly(phosphoribitol) ligase subunit 2